MTLGIGDGANDVPGRDAKRMHYIRRTFRGVIQVYTGGLGFAKIRVSFTLILEYQLEDKVENGVETEIVQGFIRIRVSQK